ncbi:MAG: hypothetical protein ACI4SM_04700 [Candidatus Gastranaerophilaceae bacterium]
MINTTNYTTALTPQVKKTKTPKVDNPISAEKNCDNKNTKPFYFTNDEIKIVFNAFKNFIKQVMQNFFNKEHEKNNFNLLNNFLNELAPVMDNRQKFRETEECKKYLT